MSNAFVTCNPAYSFILSPSWSNNCDIELMLSDIPFISVGIFAFGVSILFLANRRFMFSVVSLYFSVLLSFAAAIIDLTQTLIRDLTSVTIEPLITAREILLALSLGLRFLFYSLYVSEPPVREQRLPSLQVGLSNFLLLDRQDEPHSGNWARWGAAGSYAKFALLATIPIVTALQIIWRVFQQYNGYRPVYAADVTLEVVISVSFLLKLSLNTMPTSSIPRTHTFKECGFPALALIFNIGISIGSLVQFAFTESVLGRLLQGVELYILIVFVTIYHFFRHKQVPAVFSNERNLAMTAELPEQLRASTFILSPPVVSTPRLSTLLSSNTQGSNVNTDAAHAYVGCAIPWVRWRMSRINSNQDEDGTKLWDQDEAENGALDESQGSAGHQSVASAISAVDEGSTSWRDTVNNFIPYSLATATPDDLSVGIRSKDGSLNNENTLDVTRVGVSRRSLRLQPVSPIAIPATATPSSRSGVADITTPNLDLRSPNPPIYELDGVIGESPIASKKRFSTTSLHQFRELQIELDKIIASLRQFSPSSPTSTSSPRSDLNDEQILLPSSSVRQSSSTDRQSLSTAGARTLSDFSLSNFPSPPWSATQVPSLPVLLRAHSPRLKEDRRARLRPRQDFSSNILTLPPRIPAALTDVPSSPHSDLTSDSPYQGSRTLSASAGRPSRFDSGGTQYEITSFIGDLTTPDGRRGPTSEDEFEEIFAGAIENDSFRENSPRLPTMTLRPSPLRATPLTGAPPPGLSPLWMQERLLSVTKPEEQAPDPNSDLVEPTVQHGMRPLILPRMTITRSRPSSISSDARSSRTMFGLPPRPTFGVPKASGAFERPKPSPLILLSDDEYFEKRAK